MTLWNRKLYLNHAVTKDNFENLIYVGEHERSVKVCSGLVGQITIKFASSIFHVRHVGPTEIWKQTKLAY